MLAYYSTGQPVRHMRVCRSALSRAGPLWDNRVSNTLTENLRARTSSETDAAKILAWASFLQAIGDGTYPYDGPDGGDTITLPSHIVAPLDEVIDPAELAIQFAYGDVQNATTAGARACVLSPLNAIVNKVNDICVEAFAGESMHLLSADSVDPFASAAVPTEHLNTLDPSGMPPHDLHVKVGVPLILLRNLNAEKGMMNGTKLRLDAALPAQFPRILLATILTGPHAGTQVSIPRISLIPKAGDYPFEWRRRQFPVRLAFALTINKSQAQTLTRVALLLSAPAFTHGQLYVGLGRVGTPDNIRVFGTTDGRTRNVVYKEVLPQHTGSGGAGRGGGSGRGDGRGDGRGGGRGGAGRGGGGGGRGDSARRPPAM